jgi:hypothetical protein
MRLSIIKFGDYHGERARPAADAARTSAWPQVGALAGVMGWCPEPSPGHGLALQASDTK